MELKKHGGNVFKFAQVQGIPLDSVIDYSANINPLGLSEKVKSALLDFDDILNYPDPDYNHLTQAISRYEDVKTDYILLGNGGIECLFLLAEALKLNRVLIPVPTFIEYERAFSKYGQIRYFYNEAPFKLDLLALREHLKEVDGVVLCNPNNPTGYLIPHDDLLDFIAYAKEMNKKVILDEAFIDFTDDEASASMVKHLDEYNNLIILKSLTKFFAIPGLRLGYLMSSCLELMDHIKYNKMPWSINCMANKAGIAALSDKDYIERTKSWIISEREWFFNQLVDIGLNVYSTQGNYIFFEAPKGLDDLLKHKGVMIRNCSNYEGLSEGYYRIAIKDRAHNEQLIRDFKEILWTS